MRDQVDSPSFRSWFEKVRADAAAGLRALFVAVGDGDGLMVDQPIDHDSLERSPGGILWALFGGLDRGLQVSGDCRHPESTCKLSQGTDQRDVLSRPHLVEQAE